MVRTASLLMALMSELIFAPPAVAIASDVATQPTGEASSASAGPGWVATALVLLILVVTGRKFFAGLSKGAVSVGEAVSDADEENFQSFEERVAHRLAELQTGGHNQDDPAAASASPLRSPSPHQAPPRPSGFGRKGI